MRFYYVVLKARREKIIIVTWCTRPGAMFTNFMAWRGDGE